jgi:hypothetical protein
MGQRQRCKVHHCIHSRDEVNIERICTSALFIWLYVVDRENFLID